MTTLGDAPGGAALIEAMHEAIRNLSLAYAGTPDARASASLKRYIDRVRPTLTEAVGPLYGGKALRQVPRRGHGPQTRN